MLPRTTENAMAGHICQAGHYLPTTGLVDFQTMRTPDFFFYIDVSVTVTFVVLVSQFQHEYSSVMCDHSLMFILTSRDFAFRAT